MGDKHKYLGVVIRVIILFILALLLTKWFFSYFEQMTFHESVYKEDVAYSTIPISIDRILGDISPIVKIPLPLMRFNIYGHNNVTSKDNGNEETRVSTNLNVDVSGKYTIVTTGETKLLNKSLYINPGFSLEWSLNDVDTFDGTENNYYDGNLKIYFKPTILTFLFVWFVLMTPVVYAFIVIFSLCLKFLLTGSPVTELMEEFNRKN